MTVDEEDLADLGQDEPPIDDEAFDIEDFIGEPREIHELRGDEKQEYGEELIGAMEGLQSWLTGQQRELSDNPLHIVPADSDRVNEEYGSHVSDEFVQAVTSLTNAYRILLHDDSELVEDSVFDADDLRELDDQYGTLDIELDGHIEVAADSGLPTRDAIKYVYDDVGNVASRLVDLKDELDTYIEDREGEVEQDIKDEVNQLDQWAYALNKSALSPDKPERIVERFESIFGERPDEADFLLDEDTSEEEIQEWLRDQERSIPEEKRVKEERLEEEDLYDVEGLHDSSDGLSTKQDVRNTASDELNALREAIGYVEDDAVAASRADIFDATMPLFQRVLFERLEDLEDYAEVEEIDEGRDLTVRNASDEDVDFVVRMTGFSLINQDRVLTYEIAGNHVNDKGGGLLSRWTGSMPIKESDGDYTMSDDFDRALDELFEWESRRVLFNMNFLEEKKDVEQGQNITPYVVERTEFGPFYSPENSPATVDDAIAEVIEGTEYESLDDLEDGERDELADTLAERKPRDFVEWRLGDYLADHDSYVLALERETVSQQDDEVELEGYESPELAREMVYITDDPEGLMEYLPEEVTNDREVVRTRVVDFDGDEYR